MNSAFNEQILAEKLKKLNNTQQSIETLSHWCIFHRKKAQTVVETWDKQLRELPKEQQVPFLYLANDILQNSRRRGLEFVREFWKVLPGALKDVIEKGDSRAHTVVFRLVDIWDERKVFGSRTRSLREELLGNDPPADLLEHRVKSNHSIKIKVPAGGIQEKLASAYRSVQDVVSDEDATLGRCNAAVSRIDGLEKEANTVRGSRESQDTTTLVEELQEQQKILSHCIEQLEMCELARAALVSCLKEALREQESKLELIRSQRQTARTQVEHAANLHQQLLSSSSAGAGEIVQLAPKENESNSTKDLEGDKYQWPPPATTEGTASVMDEPKKPTSAASAAAAEVAAKLAASSSSAQVLTSVLSSMVAEEASNLRSTSAPLDTSTGSMFGEKRQRLHGQVDVLQSTEGSLGNVHQPHTSLLPLQSASMQHYSGPLQLHMPSSQHAQSQYPLPPPLPPLPHFNTSNYAPAGMQSFGYTGVLHPPPTPPGMQGQVFAGGPQMVVNPYNPVIYPPLQPPGVSVYGQSSLPAPHPPRP
ncbi:hypothetical protein GOP47_0009649 [Adiantum capillus-veneris]|uniref:CID domain-containing protein n=1 Tax=Adiantum capillus-veneris TaxID=13818 RepID=A0A9D4UXV8_ADICA|nr:hypothetical protein GOP47_0009649 [Adiantum capillus-veneris]